MPAPGNSTPIIWGDKIFLTQASKGGAAPAALSPDGKTLATGSADWTVRLWDLESQKERAVLKGHHGRIYCLAFSADGKILASGSGDETVNLWDVAAAKERLTLRGHRSGVFSRRREARRWPGFSRPEKKASAELPPDK